MLLGWSHAPLLACELLRASYGGLKANTPAGPGRELLSFFLLLDQALALRGGADA